MWNFIYQFPIIAFFTLEMNFSSVNIIDVYGKEKKGKRRRGGKTIFKREWGWTLPVQLGQLKTGQERKGLSPSHLRCPCKFMGQTRLHYCCVNFGISSTN